MGKHGDKDYEDKDKYEPRHKRDEDKTDTVEIPKVKKEKDK